jgi:hypothetical protein
VLAVQRNGRIILHDHGIEPERDSHRHEGIRVEGRGSRRWHINSDGVLFVKDGQLALNHCDIFNLFATAGVNGSCRFSGGIGNLTGFQARVVVSVNKDGPPKYDFDGTYTFSNKGND